MKTSFNWLCDWVPGLAAQGVTGTAALLTRLGFEVEGVEDLGQELSGVVIAEVVAAARPHPGADKLRIVRVRAGDREEDVVCGAPNVPPPGNRVVWAAPGARLPGGMTIAAREVRGVMSPGMLCSEPELGLGAQGDGILILSPDDRSGADFAAEFKIADAIFEVNVTPNRADALSHLGLARELASFLELPLQAPDLPKVTVFPQEKSPRDVTLAKGSGCSRYQARFVTGVTVAQSPLWMRLRLHRCGVRPLNNLVDVTNYILLELGQPLHAFDLDRVQGNVTVRRATTGESMRTLDGQDRNLDARDIVIADEKGPIALGGVMGGATSEVTAATRNLLVEAATFDAASIRRTSKRLGLQSEASYRYERGVDPEGIPRAAGRASALLASLGGGQVVSAAIDSYPDPWSARHLRLPIRRLQTVTGQAIAAESARALLAPILDGVAIEGQGDDSTLVAGVPSFRPDLILAEDLIEEVLRRGDGFGSPAAPGRILPTSTPTAHPEAIPDAARNLLAAAGFSEVATWAFVPRARLAIIGGDDLWLADGIAVQNPISADYELMRTSLLPGLADVLLRNLARGVADVAIFEVGPVVLRGAPGTDAIQSERAAGLLAGHVAGWLRQGEPCDFFDLKTVVEDVLRGLGVSDVSIQGKSDRPYLHPGISARITAPDGSVLGHIGEVHPMIARRLGLDVRAYFFEIDLDHVPTGRGDVRGYAPPRFPAATRDVSFWIAEGTAAADQKQTFLSAGEPLLRDVRVLEDFRDPKYAPVGHKGMLWSLTYRAEDRTLTDAEADAAQTRVVEALRRQMDVTIR